MRNVYDAITSNRPCKAVWDTAESIDQMRSWKGQFDEAIFLAFVRRLGIYPTDSLVRLASGRLAVVLEQHPQRLTCPVVRVLYSIRSQMPVPAERLDLALPGCSETIASRESPRQRGFTRLDELVFDGDVLRRLR